MGTTPLESYSVEADDELDSRTEDCYLEDKHRKPNLDSNRCDYCFKILELPKARLLETLKIFNSDFPISFSDAKWMVRVNKMNHQNALGRRQGLRKIMDEMKEETTLS
jgi:hypothetical protein